MRTMVVARSGCRSERRERRQLAGVPSVREAGIPLSSEGDKEE